MEVSRHEQVQPQIGRRPIPQWEENSDGRNVRAATSTVASASPPAFLLRCPAYSRDHFVGIVGVLTCQNEESRSRLPLPRRTLEPLVSPKTNPVAPVSPKVLPINISARSSKVSWVDAANHIHQFGHRLDDEALRTPTLFP